MTGSVNVHDSCLGVYADLFSSHFRLTGFLGIAGDAESVCLSTDFYDRFHVYGGLSSPSCIQTCFMARRVVQMCGLARFLHLSSAFWNLCWVLPFSIRKLA